MERLHAWIARERARPAGPLLRARWKWALPAALLLVGLVAFDAWLFTCGFAGCPSRSEIRAFRPSEGGRILDLNGRLIGRLAVVRRVNVRLADVPTHVQQAFLATEDRRFYDHGGLDWRAVGRAVVRNVSALGVREGFSTISMQVARNGFLADRYHGRSLKRKLVELRITRLIEGELTKDRILEHYLNVIYLGNGVHGVEAASRDLFGKGVKDLTVAEAALVAGLPKAPSTYTPRKSRERAKARRDVVLGLMAEEGYLSAERARALQQLPVRVAANEWRPRAREELTAIDAVRALVDSVLPDALRDGNVVVHTTIDVALQRAADRVVAKQAAVVTRETRGWYGGVAEPAEGAYVAIDPRTGDVRAMVTTARHDQRRGFNRAANARRQPGSAFKPFVYLAGIESGLSPATMVDDEPVEVAMGRTVWTPANYDGSYQGRVTLHRALMHSSNAATVRVSRTVGETKVVDAARRAGIASSLDPVPSLALGALEVTPLELVVAYASLANGGTRVKPRLVRRIEAPDGTLLWRQESESAPALDPRDAYAVTAMLRGVVDYGTGNAVRQWGIRGPVAGKTGTTNNGADVWFVGYTPSLVAGVWFGYDTPRPISGNAAGGRLAAPAWAEIFRAGWRGRAGEGFPVPDGMVPAIIDPESGALANEWCPRRQREFYHPGREPQAVCELHFEPAPPPMADAFPVDSTIGGAVESLGRRLRRIFRF